MSAPCRRNTSRLIALLSGSLRPAAAERLRGHLERCPGCALAFERMQKTAALCRSIGGEPAPALSWRQIEAQVNWRLLREEEAAGAAGRGLGWRPLVAGLAAALVVGGILGLLVGRRTAPSPAPAQHPSPGRSAPRPTPGRGAGGRGDPRPGRVNVVSSKGQAQPLMFARPLLQGERVLTSAGRVALQWEDGTGVLLGQQSEAELHRLRVLDQEINLWRGRVTAAVSHRRQGQRFSIVADRVRVQVMGTFFAVELDEKHVAIQVLEGKVLVESLDARFPPLEVPSGMAVQVPDEGRTGGRRWPAPRDEPTPRCSTCWLGRASSE